MRLIKSAILFSQKFTIRLLIWGLVLGGFLLLLILSADLLYSSLSGQLRPWHTTQIHNEFSETSYNDNFSFTDYLKLEEKLFLEVEELKNRNYDPKLDSLVSRFNPTNKDAVNEFGRDWNRSQIIEAKPERAVALLVHGLSDSPYSMRSTAEFLQSYGITCYVLRLPGHGTIPAGLDQASWKDWRAAVNLALRAAKQRSGGKPFIAFGYSTGAALLVQHAADSILAGEKQNLPKILFLYSPALGVTPFARFANLQRLVTNFGILQKARWSNIDLEFDPFKYQSFAKNAGAQISGLLPAVYSSLSKLKVQQLAEQLPPIVSFQSAIDQTVNPADLIGKLYSTINNHESELIFFNINRFSKLEALLKFSPQSLIDVFKSLSSHNFRISIINNINPDTEQVLEKSYAPSSDEYIEKQLNLAWPNNIFSLSHVAIPFAPEDPLYGYLPANKKTHLLNLGGLQMRGEKGVLVVSATDQLRLKSNPFHAYLIDKIKNKIDSLF